MLTRTALLSLALLAAPLAHGAGPSAPAGTGAGALQHPTPRHPLAATSPREAAAASPSRGPALACSGARVHFARDVEPILMSGCGGEYCHGQHISTPARAYRYLVGQTSSECDGRTIVVPGRPDASYLIEKITRTEVCAGTPMPRGAGNQLRPDELQTLYDWVCEGAPED